MTDPLSLLRQYNIEKKEIIEKNNKIIFGKYSLSKYVLTSFFEEGYDKEKEYYTLEAVLFCLKHKTLKRRKYIANALNENVPIVCRANRKSLLSYLDGKIATCKNIDENFHRKFHAQVTKSRPMGMVNSSNLPKLQYSNKEETAEESHQFSSDEYSRCKSVSTNFPEFDVAKISQRKETTDLEPVKFVVSEGGCRKLLDGPYTFTKDRVIENRTFWRCEFQVLFRCPARITTVNDQIESKWRSHDHCQSKPSPGVEVVEIKSKVTGDFFHQNQMNSVSVLDTETTQEITTKIDSNNANIDTIKTKTQHFDCFSSSLSETKKDDTENVNTLNDTISESLKMDAQNGSSAIKSEITREDVETNVQNVDKLSTSSSDSGSEDDEDASALMSSLLKLIDEMELKVLDGSSFSEEELSAISIILSLYDRLMILRKFNDALNSVILDLEVAQADDNLSEESCAGSADLSTESTKSNSTKVRAPKQRHSSEAVVSLSSEAADVSVTAAEHAETDISSSESSESDDDGSKVAWSEKITCVCVICDQPINIPPDKDIQLTMDAHLDSLHPFHQDPVDSASDDEEDSYESDEEAQLVDDRTVLLDGTKVDDYEVKFDRTNAMKYIIHSNGLYLKQDKYICFVCCAYLPLQKLIGIHLNSRSHRARIREYAEYSIEAKENHVIVVNPDTFLIRQGKLYCIECQVYLLDPHTFLSHVSEQHEQKLKLDFPIVSVGGTEFCVLCDRKMKNKPASAHVVSKEHRIAYLRTTTIVQLKCIKFCSLCHVKLFTESQYKSHVNDDTHISNLELIDTYVRDSKFGKKSKR